MSFLLGTGASLICRVEGFGKSQLGGTAAEKAWLGWLSCREVGKLASLLGFPSAGWIGERGPHFSFIEGRAYSKIKMLYRYGRTLTALWLGKIRSIEEHTEGVVQRALEKGVRMT